MILDKLRNNPRLTIQLFAVAIVLLILSTVLNNNRNNSGTDTFSGQKNITLKVPKTVPDSLIISTSPVFDLTYSVDGELLTIKPISLLKHQDEYIINVKYKDANGQDLAASAGFLYEESGKVADLLESNSIHGSVFDFSAENRYTFLAYVTVPGTNEEDVRNEAEDILRSYDINPDSVDLKIEYSRSAREDGVEDPFSPVL